MGLKSNAQNTSDTVLVKHTNEVIAEEINPTTVWFIHTWYYEQAGVPNVEKFRPYSTKVDSLVKIVTKETTIPLIVAKNTYVSGPQKYKYTAYEISVYGKLGLNGIVTRKYQKTAYSEKAGITSILETDSTPTTCNSIASLGIMLIVIIFLAIFKSKIVWSNVKSEWSNDATRYFLTMLIGIVFPVVVITISYLSTSTGFTELRNALYLYTQRNPVGLIFNSGGIFIACGLLEFALTVLMKGNLPKQMEIFMKKTSYTRWIVIVFIYYAIIFHAFTHSYLIVGLWFLVGLGVRVLIIFLRELLLSLFPYTFAS